MRSAVVAVIPAGATFDVRGCRSWCRVNYGGMMGFVPSPYVTALGSSPAYYGSAGYGAGPFDILTAPFSAVGGLFGGGSTYGYGEAASNGYGGAPSYGYRGAPSYGYGEPPVVAGY